MRNIFVDINVVLDVACERRPHLDASQNVLIQIEKGKARGHVSAASFPTLFYLLTRDLSADDAREYLAVLAELFHVVPVEKTLLARALTIGIEDYEDALQAAAAEACGAESIITRDAKGYKDSPVPPMTPVEFLATLAREKT